MAKANSRPFEEGVTLRIRSVRECPGGVFWFVQTDRVKKEIDRYSFEATQYLLYDSAKKLAEAYHEFRRRRSLVAISPNGEKAYVGVAGSDFGIFDTKTLKRLPTVELAGEIVGTIHVVDRMSRPQVVVVDSVIDPQHPGLRGGASVIAGPRFDRQGIAEEAGGGIDDLGHGSAVAAIIAIRSPARGLHYELLMRPPRPAG